MYILCSTLFYCILVYVLLISYVYTVFYPILLYLNTFRSDIARPYTLPYKSLGSFRNVLIFERKAHFFVH
jgi:hypothetical protein